MKISCVVPIFNEGKIVVQFLNDLENELFSLNKNIEILIVNDGSDNGTEVLLRNFKNKKNFKYIEFTRNFGKEAAITAGINFSTGDCCFIIDADYQHPFSYLKIMLDEFNKGFDVVYCYIESRSRENLPLRFFKSFFYKYLFSSNQFNIPPNAGDFRLLSKSVVNKINLLHEKNRYMKGIYSFVGYKSKGIPYIPALRKEGISKFDYNKLIILGLDGLTSFSIKPLFYSFFIGILLCFISVISSIYIVIMTLVNGTDVLGWPSIFVSIIFFAGLQLFFIGIIGIYIGKNYIESKNRPIYIVDELNSF